MNGLYLVVYASTIYAFSSFCLARSWRSIELLHDTDHVSDASALFYMHVRNQFYRAERSQQDTLLTPPKSRVSEQHDGFGFEPATNAPSPMPSASPSLLPTPKPTSSPTPIPTLSPTDFPTMEPTPLPTAHPSSAPAKDPYLATEPPFNPDPWYFDYDLSPQSTSGPGKLGLVRQGTQYEIDIQHNGWGNVERPPSDYWDEFTSVGFGPWKNVLDIHQPSRNKCESGTLQSPIDIHENEAICDEFHEVRSLRGDYQVHGSRVEKKIENNKLRLVFARRPCSDLSDQRCREPDPPQADFPRGWGGMADALHADFKVPSEHTLMGEQFDAEMQIYHIHAGRRRLAAQSVLIQARVGGYNFYLQEALNTFQKQYDKNMQACGRRMQWDERAMAEGKRTLIMDEPFEDYLSWAKNLKDEGKGDFEPGPWDPHHEMLIPTIHFYRYEGSLTEPPCGEFVSWWIADEPMTISYEQLEQMKQILFTNVDSSCKMTSVQVGQSVARPTRKTNQRPIWRCTEEDFGPDP